MIELRGIIKSYAEGRVVALNGLDLEVSQREFVTIVGPSGCGKSTMLRVIHGLERPDRGEVLIRGVPVTSPEINRAFVFQDYSLFPWRTVYQNVMFGLELQNLHRTPEADQRIRQLLDLMALSAFPDAYPHELSGGMQQRVAIARALAINPEILLMDEPFASLDAFTREALQLEMTRIWQRTQKTVVFITHSLEEAVFLSTRVDVMSFRPGRIKASLPVPFPYPRDIILKMSPEFQEIRRNAWSVLQQEMLKFEVQEGETVS